MRKSSYSIKLKIVSFALAILMSSTFMAGCNKEKDSENPVSTSTTSSQAKSTAKEKNKSTKDETSNNETTTAAGTESTATTAKSNSSSSSGNSSTGTLVIGNNSTTTTTKKLSTQDSGLSNKNTEVDKATDASDLKNVDAEDAAKQSSNTEIASVDVESGTVESSEQDEYTLVEEANFESHILNTWKNFKVTDKVKIKADLVNEYLNYAVLPLKNSFYEINCKGYETTGLTDGTYAYLTIKYYYYVDASQYAQCVSLAQSIVNNASGTLVEKIRYCHDYINAHTTYVINVDGAYNCLVKGQCDCDGYTAAFQICMELLGVPCKAYCTENHIFNLVQVSGSWYAVDVTWDDSDDYGISLARYFLRGSSMYSSYSILNSMLSSSDYPDSRKGYIYDKAKLIAKMNLPSDSVITPGNDGYFEVTSSTQSGYFYLT